MALETTVNRVSFAGNGVTTAFSFPYYFLAEADLVVIQRVNSTGVETTKTLTTHYTITGEGEEAGGTVTMLVAPPTGQTLIIYRDPAVTQSSDWRENDSLPAEQTEQAHDRAMMISQRLKDRVDRTVRLSDGFSPTFDPILPSTMDDAAGKIPLVNAGSTGWAATSTWPDVDGVTAGMAAALAAAQAAQAAAELAETNAETAETNAETAETNAETAETNAETAETNAETAATLAQDWATKTTATVDGSDYSSKEWAKGTQTRGAASGGSSKDWANYTGGTVDNTEYSAKKYATDSAASAAAAAAALASAFFRDVVYITSADSPFTITQAHNGKLISASTAGGAISVTMPAIAGLALPFNVGFLLATAGNNLTLNRSSTDTIAGATSKVLSAAGTGTQLVADTDGAPDDYAAMDFGTLADDSATNTKLANMAQSTIKGRAASAGTGDPTDLTPTQVAAMFTTPTVQRLTASNGSYTTPANVKWIRIRLVGAGGGGGGSGTTAISGGPGGPTSFGGTIAIANGGGSGFQGPSVGGTVTVNSPAVAVVALAGAAGGGHGYNGSSGPPQVPGGRGGSSPFGGAGAAGGNPNSGTNTGGDAVARSGSGGGGGGTGGTTVVHAGGGGAAGGFIEAIIAAPSASYTYAIGTGGTAAAAGTSGAAGGAGGSGIIIVEEFYV